MRRHRRGFFLPRRWQLREYYRRRGIELGPDQVMATTGGSEALLFSMLACANDGDEALIVEPFYTNYIAFATMSGIRLLPLRAKAENGFHLPPRQAWEKALTPRTKLVLLCNPNNPTGTVYTREEVLRVAAFCREKGLFLLSDEVYREFVYDGRTAVSALTLEGYEDLVVVADSLSKRYSACGIRLGSLATRNRGDIVRQRGVHETDPYSFTSDRPWINHEWLSEVLIYGAYAAAGAHGLVLLRVAVVSVVAFLALLHLRPLRRDPVVHDASLALVILGVYGQTYTIRPQLFSILVFSVLLLMLVASARQPRWLWAIPLLMGLWVNLHGGWLVGAATAGLWVLGTVASGRGKGRFLAAAAGAGVLSAVALLANPYGHEMLAFLFETAGPSRPDIREWLPVYRLGAYITFLWLVPIAFALFVVVRSRGRVS